MRVLITTDTVGGVWSYTRELVSGLLAERHFRNAGHAWTHAECGASGVDRIHRSAIP